MFHRVHVLYVLRFGEHYARMMLIFAMVVIFSISCPLITPFGCLYFILKHLVDKHNLGNIREGFKVEKKIKCEKFHTTTQTASPPRQCEKHINVS